MPHCISIIGALIEVVLALAIFVFLLTLGAAAVFTYFGPEHLCRIGYRRGPNGRDWAACRSSFDHRIETNDSNFDEGQLEDFFSHQVLDPVIRRWICGRNGPRTGCKLSLESHTTN